MKRYSPLLFAIFSLLIPAVLCAQAKSGFKKLNDREYEDAVEAFEKCLEKKDPDTCACFYGLSKSYLAMARKDSKKMEPAHEYNVRCRACLEKADKETLQEWKDRYSFSAATAKTNARNVGNAYWKAKGKTGGIYEADVYLKNYVGLNKPYDTLAMKVQRRMEDSVMTGRLDYPTTQYIYQTRAPEWRSKRDSALAELDYILLEKYFETHAGGTMRQFVSENPEHTLSRMPDKPAMLAAMESGELSVKLDRLAVADEPLEMALLEEQIVSMLKQDPSLSEGKTLNASQKAMLEDFIVGDNQMQMDDRMAIRRLTAASAPSFSDVKRQNQAFIAQKKWRESELLLERAAEKFPEQKDWFAAMRQIVSAPEKGIVPVSLGDSINNTKGQYLPVVTADGNTLYYCQNVGGSVMVDEDVYVSRKVGGQWQKGAVISDLSQKSRNDAPLSVSADGNYMILFRNGKPFEATRTASGWTEPKPLSLNLSAFAWVGTVQISANRQVMILEAAETRGGGPLANIDIFISKANALGEWSDPVRLEAPVNTAMNERSPFLHPDMTTMYFSTEGRPGLGSLDVFVTRRLDETWLNWSEPVNLGKEINTVDEDWGYRISTDGATAWFATRVDDRAQDIFSCTIPEAVRPQEVCTFTISLTDKAGKPLEAEVVIEDRESGVKIGSFSSDPSTGNAFITLPIGKTYHYYVSKEGYFPISRAIDLHTCDPVKAQLEKQALQSIAEMVEGGKTATLNNIFFDYDQETLRPESLYEIRRVAEIAKSKKVKVTLQGHTDNQGGEAYNLDLSKRRAEAVGAELVRLGVPADQVRAEGYGESKALTTNDTDAGRQLNRRVEVLFSE